MKNSGGARFASKRQIIACVVGGLLFLAHMASAQTPTEPDAEQVRRGEYLARAGNCMGCHTARGGEPYAGGRKLNTPFGEFVTGCRCDLCLFAFAATRRTNQSASQDQFTLR